MGRSCRHSQRDVEEFDGLVWIALRQVEPLCARTCAAASASVALPLPACTHVQHPRSLLTFFRWQVALRHPLASLPLVALALLLAEVEEQAPDAVQSRSTISIYLSTRELL